MTRGDRLILAAVVVSVLLSAPVALAAASGRAGDMAVITGPAGRTEVPLDSYGRYEIAGRGGTVTFDVTPDGVFCVESSCPDHVCVRQHEALPGRPVVCAPNGVVASIGSAPKGGELDAVSR